MIDVDNIRDAALPILAGLGLSLYDVEITGSGRARTLRITMTASDGGLGIDQITDATRALDVALDDLIDGPCMLEISSPGLERALRRPEHFATAVGSAISVKFRDTDANATVRRDRAQLLSHSDESIVVLLGNGTEHTIRHDAIIAAHTVFEWGPAPRPGKGKQPAAQRTKETTRS